MSEPWEVEDFEEKMEKAKKNIEDIKKKYAWMDMRSDFEKQRETEDLVRDLCIQEDLETDHTYDPNATKITDFHPDARREMEQGIKDHALTLVNTHKAYEAISDQTEIKKRIPGAQVYGLLLKLKQDFPDKSEKELLAEAYRIFKEGVADFAFSAYEKVYSGKGEMEYLDAWKRKLEQYIHDGLTWEEALLRIYREERTGKSRIGNEQYRDDIKLGPKHDFDGDNETGVKTLGELTERIDAINDLIYSLDENVDDYVDDYIRDERNMRIIKEIGDFEKEKHRTLTDAEYNKVFDHLKNIWNKQHNFND